MNAFQPSRPPLQTPKPRQIVRRRRSPHTATTLETTVKLSINIILLVLATYALVRLGKYDWSQQQKLQELRTENEQLEGRVTRLQTDFSRYFDPQQTQNIMQEQSDRLAPGQRPVVLVKSQVQRRSVSGSAQVASRN